MPTALAKGSDGRMLSLCSSSAIKSDWEATEFTFHPTQHADNEPDSITRRPEFSAEPKKNCSSNEKYTECYALCQYNCDNYDEPYRCNPACIWGCICESGYVRGPNKTCIRKEECPSKPEQAEVKDHKKCPTKEHWNRCEAHCQKNCSNYNDKIDCPPKCESGCVCNDGFVRGADGTCILPYECYKKAESDANSSLLPNSIICGTGQRLDVCPSTCPVTCDNYIPGERKRKKCYPLICVPGCVCNDDLVEKSKGECIKPNKCPNKSEYIFVELFYYLTCFSLCTSYSIKH
ncbi:zonadhesin [Nephila pilipes]|uniref:Zonadhesin n=1 Tax=Nephila pilipes TaxID=299642 RepID=A0A8X6NU30_NEPPI|nr:zonadhesin [Nephila pilipes]